MLSRRIGAAAGSDQQNPPVTGCCVTSVTEPSAQKKRGRGGAALIFSRAVPNVPPVKYSALILALLFSALAPAYAEGKKVVLFAMLLEETPVQLADGAKWLMDKGDAFPVLQFKDQQTVLVLQLAGTQFLVPAKNVRVLEEDEVTDEVMAAYRRNVVNYLEGKVKKWRAAAKGKSEE
ncbi:MAG: hypothetical protein QOE70_4828 [Chthoniobacter sp.]|jgi:hypothetical protein|nr:hypothetical protein [Chthoniobacter sp.]